MGEHYTDELYHSDELMHYGVPGMKWGVRNDYVPTGRRRTRSGGLTTGQKIGDGVAGAAAIGAGAYALRRGGGIRGVRNMAKLARSNATVYANRAKNKVSNARSQRQWAREYKKATGQKYISPAQEKKNAQKAARKAASDARVKANTERLNRKVANNKAAKAWEKEFKQATGKSYKSAAKNKNSRGRQIVTDLINRSKSGTNKVTTKANNARNKVTQKVDSTKRKLDNAKQARAWEEEFKQATGKAYKAPVKKRRRK